MKFNKNKAKKYLVQEKNIFCSKEIIRKVYMLNLKPLFNYAILKYEADIFAKENKRGYYAED